ncbi:MAG: hypothetical protein OXI59_05500, partial [Gemmatimonadota bacterium]|nr:hypothetical protein [Gemmatimonadota bacterium]
LGENRKACGITHCSRQSPLNRKTAIPYRLSKLTVLCWDDDRDRRAPVAKEVDKLNHLISRETPTRGAQASVV